MPEYNFKSLQAKWLGFWDDHQVYKTPERPTRKKFYCLEMFAYPSGDIHMGHFRNYTIGDVVARFKMLQGFDVLHPFGWDAFGLPAEQAAIKHGIHPREWTLNNINQGRATLKRMGISYDWDREVLTCNPDYYKWTQWVFLQLYKRGLVYRGTSTVNWCEGCQTVIADEQVVAGNSCWRGHEGQVTKKKLDNCWFFRYTQYAERLLKDIDRLEGWPEYIRTMQRNWIGRSEGCEIDFKVDGTGEPLTVFTTRPDTVYGVTFVVIAPEHPLAAKLSDGTPYAAQVREYIERAGKKSEIERTAVGEKDGVFTGRYAVNPFSREKVPIWVADYVLASYGTGVVMGVPAHDERDFQFAKKYGFRIKIVIQPKGQELDPAKMTGAYVEPGVMVNSGPFDRTWSEDGIRSVIEYGAQNGFARPKVHYRLRDWLISRQRYWGCPIPIIHCDRCGIVPVPEEQLPVVLPSEGVDFVPKGRSPLADHKGFMETTCPQCKGSARRDPDTMDTFMCSSWYLFRYVDPHNDRQPWRKELAEAWLPVDLYIGGTEHACGHLLYFRYITKILHEAGWLPVDEPVIRLFNQGMVLDARGEVMSKSKGNVVSPAAILDQYGVDVARLMMLFFAPSDAEIKWDDRQAGPGARRFVDRVWQLVHSIAEQTRGVDPKGIENAALGESFKAVRRKLHQVILKTTWSMEKDLAFNTAIARMMELLNLVDEHRGRLAPRNDHERKALRELAETLTVLLAPMAPFLGEELWTVLGGTPSIFKHAQWPVADPEVAKEETLEIPVQINGKLRGRVTVAAETGKDELRQVVMEQDFVKKALDGKKPRKVIIVPETPPFKLVNIVL